MKAVVPLSLYPVKFSFSVATHEYVVPVTSVVKSNWSEASVEQTSWDVTVLVMDGVWLNVITTVSEAGVSQFEPTVTVILYVPKEFSCIVGNESEAVVPLTNA